MTRFVDRLFSAALLICTVGFILVGCDFEPSDSDSSSGVKEEFDLNNCTISADKFESGGVGKDGIPALTDPSLAGADAGNIDYLSDGDRVIGFLFGDKALAVPHNILWHHEIANFNDWEGETIAVTYCPLTGSSLVFDRSTVGSAELGVSGLLLANNLVMYDRNDEESLWPQMNRKANCGRQVGQELTMLPAIEMKWGHWKELHPNTSIITKNTGFDRNYSSSGYPYGNYEANNNDRLLIDMEIDRRRPPKERVLGIPSGSDGGVALPFGALDKDSPVRVVTVAVGGSEKTVFWNRDARSAMAFETSATFSVRGEEIVDDETGSVWTIEGRAVEGPRTGEQLVPVEEAYVAFWFAWAHFQKETTIWTPSSS